MKHLCTKLGCLAAATFASVGLVAAPAVASAITPDNPVFIPLTPWPGPAPANCPPAVGAGDTFGLLFVSGNANKSGETVEGDAWLLDLSANNTPVDFGHTTLWGNAKAFTLSFHGAAISFHVTENTPHGLQVANITCA